MRRFWRTLAGKYSQRDLTRITGPIAQAKIMFKAGGTVRASASEG
jgi:hypothetical protein